METIVIRESRGKSLKLLLIMFAGMALLTWGLLVEELESHPDRIWALRILSAAALPFCTAGTVLQIWKFLKPRPLMTLTPEGLRFCCGWSGSRFVAWSAVRDITLVKIGAAKILCIALCNREQYLAALSRIQQWVAALSKSMGYDQPIQIPLETVRGYSPAEVVELIQKYHRSVTA